MLQVLLHFLKGASGSVDDWGAILLENVRSSIAQGFLKLMSESYSVYRLCSLISALTFLYVNLQPVNDYCYTFSEVLRIDYQLACHYTESCGILQKKNIVIISFPERHEIDYYLRILEYCAGIKESNHLNLEYSNFYTMARRWIFPSIAQISPIFLCSFCISNSFWVIFA
jgi:hypothetical protein